MGVLWPVFVVARAGAFSGVIHTLQQACGLLPGSLSHLEIVGCKSAAAVHFLTVFLPHSRAMGLQIRQKLSSLGPILAFDAPSPTDS